MRTNEEKLIIINYLQSRIDELVEEGKKAIAIHGMPSWPYHQITTRIGVLEKEIEKLQKEIYKHR